MSVVPAPRALAHVDLERLATIVGATPFFAYDRAAITERVGLLRAQLPGDVHLSYAIKANPMAAVVQHLSGLVDAFDTASAGELRVALDTPMPALHVSFAGPGKTPEELTRAVAAGALIELESFTEARRVVAIGERLGVRPRVAIRVNPDFAIKGSGMRMGGGPQQFGVDAERVPELLAELAVTDVDWLGFHVFAGSQNLDAGILAEAQRRTVELVLRLADDAPGPVRHLNIGGGLGIPYHDRDAPLDLAAVGGALEDLMAAAVRPLLPEARVVLELGRYLVGEAGVYVTRVVDRKESRGTTFLVVDGGMHHQLAASGNLGQVIKRNYPVEIAGRDTGEPTETQTVVGCLCTPLDVLARDAELPRAEIGELVVVRQAGAYGLTASPTAFLGHPQPAEALV